MSLKNLLTPNLTTAPSHSGGTPNYTDPGNPLTDLLSWADNARGTVFDLPLIILASAYLYDKAWLDGEDTRGWGPGDIIFIVVVSWLIKRIGVGQRWEGTF